MPLQAPRAPALAGGQRGGGVGGGVVTRALLPTPYDVFRCCFGRRGGCASPEQSESKVRAKCSSLGLSRWASVGRTSSGDRSTTKVSGPSRFGASAASRRTASGKTSATGPAGIRLTPTGMLLSFRVGMIKPGSLSIGQLLLGVEKCGGHDRVPARR